MDMNEKNGAGSSFKNAVTRMALKAACELGGVPRTQWMLMDILVKNGCDSEVVMDSINEWIDAVCNEGKKPEAQDNENIPEEAPKEVNDLVQMLRNSGLNVEVIRVNGGKQNE